MGMLKASKQAYLEAKEVENKGNKSLSVLGPNNKGDFDFDDGISGITMHPKMADNVLTAYTPKRGGDSRQHLIPTQ